MKRFAIAILILIFPAILLSTSISFMVGQFRPNANSDIWDVNFENLILSKKNFNNTIYYFEWENVRWKSGLFFGFGSYLTRVNTEYRDFVYWDGSPIEQRVTFKEIPFQLGWRFYPIPVRRKGLLPFIGAGVEYVSWEWRQDGDFIDFSDPDLPIYPGDYKRTSGNFGVFLNGGLLLKFDRKYAIRLSVIYHVAKGSLEPIFLDFEPIDLSGLMLMGGISIYY